MSLTNEGRRNRQPLVGRALVALAIGVTGFVVFHWFAGALVILGPPLVVNFLIWKSFPVLYGPDRPRRADL